MTYEFDPRPAHMPDFTERTGGSGPGSWAGSGDHPDTRAPAVPTAALIVPTAWLVLGGNYAELLIQRIDMVVVDFYWGRP